MKRKKERTVKEKCVVCHDNVFDKTSCRACHKGPICMTCMGNDIEHGVEENPICEECIVITHWCTDCHQFIALPSEDPLIEGFLCEGYGDVVCGVLICEYCSYGDYYFDASEDEEPPLNRLCAKCREQLSPDRQ